jgi:large subunit ribosomal protein L21
MLRCGLETAAGVYYTWGFGFPPTWRGVHARSGRFFSQIIFLAQQKVRDTPMHAIIETGGKQFRVTPGDVVRVPKLAGDAGAEIELGKVLAVFQDGGELLTGEGAGNARVNATISGHDRADKILVFKFKRKKQYKRTQGHRQDYTEVRIRDIVA